MKKLLFICFAVMVYSFAVNASPKSNSNSTFYCPSPVINSFSPSQGPVNTQITLVGSNFENTASVNIDGVSTSFTIVSNNELLVTIPEGAESSAITVLTTGACSGTSANSFTVLEDSCSIGEVYISEVYDSETGSYGAVELYNPTNTVINLNGVYELQRFGDIGDATPSAIIPLTGTIAPQSTYMIVMGSTGNTCSGFPIGDAVAAGINDNDEIKLVKNSTVIDVVEAIDERGYTIIRNANATAPLDTYNVSDWSISTFEDCSNLNTHTDTANNTIPEITDPISQTVCENGMITFSTSLNNSIFQYQWKVLDTSGNWVDVPNSSPYSNPQNSWLDITNVPLSFNGNQYYCEVTYNSCTLITNAAQITIDTPEVDTLPDVEVCTEYTLPTLTNGNYFTGTNGTGTMLNAGDNITTNQTIYIYNEVGTAPNTCSNESSFEVTITGTPNVDSLPDVEVCTEYTLPTLTNGNYYTATNGTGTQLNAGDNITTNQTIYIYNEVGTAPNNCSNESSFEITITGTPSVDSLPDLEVCTEYTLPTLTNGNYFTGTNGTGTQLNAGDNITTNQTIYIYNEVGIAPNTCSNESSFEVTITGTPSVDSLPDVDVCSEYTLPTLTNGNYYTATNGTGTQLNAGDNITTNQTIYIYNEVGTAPNTCSNESSFEVTITGTPSVDSLPDVEVCTEYTLPTLTNGNYYTATNGTGTMLNAGDNITTNQTIYIYNEVGTAPNNCSNESSFEITITGTPSVDSLPDVDVCTEYTLPTLTNGNYYTATNGTGTQLNAGDNITTNQTIYIYNEVGTAPNTCSNESSFEVTIYPATDFSLDSTNIIIDANDITVVMDDSSINYEFAIDNSNFQTSTIFNNLSEGFHTLFVQDTNGCVIKSLQFLIQASLHIPKFFTPNSDGFNDTWMVYDPNNSVKEIFIFNRYGKLLKQLSPNSYGWDGTYNGKNLESNDYWYLITLHNNQELRGHFTLKR
ncbi:T9SS type B sorting domain-containing protein [Gaetbulibacter jejuensis]